ncbi:PadR family transcriptional regulator [Tumebacillus flagellatus]|uniref:PadR family transcriptional regulator n=1 Tax=Tumebacillus flagellatus TaxID=1157490 RepID=A0A074LLQ9_9BACL|nr:PadR family transcriptional regulator [Tumebacillus flagellatus]KEO80818.1 PadR family transcriptional regulator [Tumebacillus flagellatus]
MEIDKEILKGYVDTIILATLRERPLYGYELAKTVRERSLGSFELKEGTMYLALKRLEKNEFIESYWGDEEASGGGRRKYYRLRQAGEQRYLDKKREWQFVKQTMETFFKEGTRSEGD